MYRQPVPVPPVIPKRIKGVTEKYNYQFLIEDESVIDDLTVDEMFYVQISKPPVSANFSQKNNIMYNKIIEDYDAKFKELNKNIKLPDISPLIQRHKKCIDILNDEKIVNIEMDTFNRVEIWLRIKIMLEYEHVSYKMFIHLETFVNFRKINEVTSNLPSRERRREALFKANNELSTMNSFMSQNYWDNSEVFSYITNKITSVLEQMYALSYKKNKKYELNYCNDVEKPDLKDFIPIFDEKVPELEAYDNFINVFNTTSRPLWKTIPNRITTPAINYNYYLYRKDPLDCDIVFRERNSSVPVASIKNLNKFFIEEMQSRLEAKSPSLYEKQQKQLTAFYDQVRAVYENNAEENGALFKELWKKRTLEIDALNE